MPKGHKPYLGEIIDRYLVEMKRNPDSYYYKILNTWLERYEHHKHGGIPRWLFISLAALLGTVMLLMANSAFLKSTVRRRTAQLKTSLESLQESEARYRALFEGAAEGILVADIETKQFIYANPAICRMLGYTQEELIQMHTADIHPAESLDRITADLEAQMHGEKLPAAEIKCLRKDAGIVYADITTAPIVVDGRKCSVGFFADVTQRKKLEEQFNQAQKLEAVGQLAGGVAHDFNNILTAQLGYCDLMKRRLKDADPVTADLAQIKICAERAATLTRQLLAFSRKQTLEPKVLNLNTIVTNIEKMLKRLIGEHIEFVTVLSDGLGSVKADPARIEQVIMNLAVNARDAMPQGGRLTIETANVVLDENYAREHVDAAAGPHVMLAISDNGCGMDEQTKRRLFEPFFTTKSVGKGTGLGLATVYGIVKQSGGNIWVYSEPGEGTTFKIFLPRVEAAPAQPAEHGTMAARGKGELILVVEDEAALRDIFTRMIENLGYRVKVAANGVEAITMIEQEGLRPDLLITDVVMPKMGGRELVERLSRIQPGLKALYTSGHASSSFIDHTGLDPGVPFLQKPFSSDELAEKIQGLIRAKG